MAIQLHTRAFIQRIFWIQSYSTTCNHCFFNSSPGSLHSIIYGCQQAVHVQYRKLVQLKNRANPAILNGYCSKLLLGIRRPRPFKNKKP